MMFKVRYLLFSQAMQFMLKSLYHPYYLLQVIVNHHHRYHRHLIVTKAAIRIISRQANV